MILLLLAGAVLVASGVLCFALHGRPRLAAVAGAAGAALAGVLGLVAAGVVLVRGAPIDARVAWGALGTLHVTVDPLAAFFLVPVLLLTALCAVYGVDYMRGEHGVGAAAGLLNLLGASLVGVVVAGDALLFLLSWEAMAITSFFLVVHDSDRPEVREAGWTYLIATHIGTSFLIAFFVALSSRAGGSLDFAAFPAAAAGLPPAAAGALFVFAVVGFGTKAGVVPLHVWLPEAHPAAPSHVSALLSGVMIKTGIYGLVRALDFFPTPPAWWGWALLVAGVTSGVLGVLFALAQHDMKRLLAYHSVENIGIIVLGLGLGVLGRAHGSPALAALGFGGALLHVVNHALFKGLLFLAAGAAARAAGTREIDHLGGLLRRMPATGLAFAVGAIAICGLPPLNGFASELLLYLAAFGAISGAHGSIAGPAALAIVGLALIGALAVACFTKVFGVVFLGEPRRELPAGVADPGPLARLAMAVLAAACILVGILAPLALLAVRPAAARLAGGDVAALDGAGAVLGAATTITAVLGVVVALAWATRRRLLRRRPSVPAVTWDCGYAAPTPRMQYTASSYADPILTLFRGVLGTRRRAEEPRGYFPGASSLATETDEPAQTRLFAPAAVAVREQLARLGFLQRGGVHRYVLFLALTLVALLLWKL